MGVNSITGGSSVTSVVITSPKAEVTPAESKAEATQTSNYTVELSSTALAKSLKLQGQNPTQIAQQMGVDIKTVDSYLSIKPSAPTVIPTQGQASTTPVIPAEPCWITDIVSSSAYK